MGGSGRWYEFSSSELADFIFSNYDFDVDLVVDVYSRIVRETAYSANDLRSGFDARENLKELMRFRFLTRLFSRQSSGSTTINAVYHRLSNVPRIRENDQFWLQYAMARMEDDDLDAAETYVNTALGLAGKKGEAYSKRQILDQRVRLVFKKNARLGRTTSGKELRAAIQDLIGLLNERGESVIHPLRSSGELLELLENKIDELGVDLVQELLILVDLMKAKLPERGRLEKSRKGETEVITNNIRACRIILANA